MNNTFNDLIEFVVISLNKNVENVVFTKYLLEREKYLPLKKDLCILSYKNITSNSKVFCDYSGIVETDNKNMIQLARQFKGTISFDFYSKSEEDCYKKLNEILEYLAFSKELNIISFDIKEVKKVDNLTLCNFKFEVSLLFTLTKSQELNTISALDINTIVK